jgi:hypothetical protein
VAALIMLVTIVGESLLAFGLFHGLPAASRFVGIILNILQCAVILSGVSWFISTTQFQPRAAFDIACTFFRINQNRLVAEVQFIFENKGFVDIYVDDLTYSIHTVGREQPPKTSSGDEIKFAIRLIPSDRSRDRLPVIPESLGYVYIRPGVRQCITRIVSLRPDVEVISVTSGFSYSPIRGDEHTSQRVFLVPPPELSPPAAPKA